MSVRKRYDSNPFTSVEQSPAQTATRHLSPQRRVRISKAQPPTLATLSEFGYEKRCPRANQTHHRKLHIPHHLTLRDCAAPHPPRLSSVLWAQWQKVACATSVPPVQFICSTGDQTSNSRVTQRMEVIGVATLVVSVTVLGSLLPELEC